ncbi:bifunctional glycosyltransferase/CDP-glycerol:glycerophosphate glycerophosphotransferase [Methanobrevibacter sp.]
MVFLSIIIPFNKSKRYLIDCLDSLVEQNLNDYEIILIINGYPTAIDDLLNNYSVLNIKTIEFEEELGVARARNEGLKNAQGEYVYFLDGDDYIYQNGLSKLIDVARATHADFINGERINTAYIRDRVEEQRHIQNENYLLNEDFDGLEFPMILLVGSKTNKLELMSALHSLIRKDKITAPFNESQRYFSDYEFMVNVVKNCKTFEGVENAIYIKRIRDDPINLTSLNQEPKAYGFLYHCQNYWNIINQLGSDEASQKLKDRINFKYRRFYFNRFAIKYLNSAEKEWSSVYLDEMSRISQNFDITNLSRHNKKEVLAIQAKDEVELKKLIKRRARKNKLGILLKKRWMFKSTIYEKYYNRQPVKENKILFESFYGKFYSDSPKYLYEFLYENFPDDFEFVWVLNKGNVKIPGNPVTVKRFSLDYYKHLAQSKYLVFNTRQPKRLNKREEQVYIETWHGTPLKRLGFDQGNLYLDNPDSKKSYRNDSKKWDYMVSPNEYTSSIYRSAFAYEGDIIESGYPRNDILYNASAQDIVNIKKRLKLPLDKKIILYAPTWRDDEYYDTASVKFTLELDLNRLKEEFDDEYIIILRLHYFIADNIDLKGLKGFVYDLSKHEDIAELYLISDMLITDYSSVFFDYANLKRPILFYTYDLDKYENVLRGFYIDINEVPGPLLMTNDEVISTIKNIDKINEEYLAKYDKFYNNFCYLEDGNASKRVYDEIWGNSKLLGEK